MSARILSFFRYAPGLQGDWSHQEIAEFYRVEAATLQAGVRIITDRGVSDEGDPWFVFCRPQDEGVFLHFARIDGLYYLGGEGIEGVLRGPDFRALLTELTQRHPTFLPIPPQGPNSTVLLHPGALLTAIVVTACLLAAPTDAFANAQALDLAPHALKPGPASDTPMSGADVSHISPERDVREETQDLTERRAFIAGAAYLAASFAMTLTQPEDYHVPSVGAPKSLDSLGTESVEQAKSRVRAEDTAVQDLRFQSARSDQQDGAIDLLNPTHTPSWLRSSPDLLFVGSSLGHQRLNSTQPSGPLSIGFVGQAELGHTASAPHDVQILTAGFVQFPIFLERTAVTTTAPVSGGTAIKSGINVVVVDARPSDNPIPATVNTTVHALSTTIQQTSSSESSIQPSDTTSIVKAVAISSAASNPPSAETTQKIQAVISNIIGSSTSSIILSGSEGGSSETSGTQIKAHISTSDSLTGAQHALTQVGNTLSNSSQTMLWKASGLTLTSPSDSLNLVSLHTTPIATTPDGYVSDFTSVHITSSAMISDAKVGNTALGPITTDPTLHTTVAAGNGTGIQSLGISSVRDGLISVPAPLGASAASMSTSAQITTSSFPSDGSSVSGVVPTASVGAGPSLASVTKVDPSLRTLDASQTQLIDAYIAHTAHLGVTLINDTLLLFDTVPVIGSSAQVTTWDLGGGSRLEIVGLSNVVHG